MKKWLLLPLLAASLAGQVTERRVAFEGKDYMVMRVVVNRRGETYRRQPVPYIENVTVFTPHSKEGTQWRGEPKDIISRGYCVEEACSLPDLTFVKRALGREQ